MSLWELTNEYQALYEMADDEDMEAKADVWFDTMEGLDGEIEQKIDNTTKVVKNLEADASVIRAQAAVFKAEYERLENLAKTKDNAVKRLKRGITEAMLKTGKTKFKTDSFSFWTATTKSVEIDENVDVYTLPPKYLKYKNPDVDKKLLKADIEAGETFDWATLKESTGVRWR